MPTSEAHIIGSDKYLASLNAQREKLRTRIASAMKRQMFMLAEFIRANKLSGQVLNRRSGDLSRATTGQVLEENNSKVVGAVGTYGIPYAPVHEFGWVGERTVAQAFGRPIIPKDVTFHYPERSFIRSSVSEKKDAVVESFRTLAGEMQRGRA